MRVVFALCVLLLLSACSWQEYFVVYNSGRYELSVRYKMDISKNGFFDCYPTVYSLDERGEMDWNKKIDAKVLMQEKDEIELVIPPNSAVIIGTISNDHYRATTKNTSTAGRLICWSFMPLLRVLRFW